MKGKLYLLVVGLICLLSFRCYSSLFYPILNSDNAVTILMIYYFKLPHDLYFWGQDRMGSLIPLIGQIFFKIFNLSALRSEAIVHYLILLAGFLAFASFLKSNFLKIIFAIIWFFPPIRLIDTIQLYSGVEYSLIAISCYLLNLYQKTAIQENVLFRHLILFSIALLLIGSVWVSDMALVTVFLLLGIQLFFYLQTNKFSYALFKKMEFYYSVLSIIGGYIFIQYAKSTSPTRQDYSTFSDFEVIRQTCIIFKDTIIDLLTFKANEPFTSVYTYFVIVLFSMLLFQIKNIKLTNTAKKWILFFIFDAFFLFIIIIVSNWTFLNGVPRRYFTCTYISISFAFLLLLDNLNISTSSNALRILSFTAVFIGGVGAIYNIKFIWPKTMTPRVEVVNEFQKLGKIGIISEYWNSYITSCPNPEMIKATPHEAASCRNYEIVEEVFQQKNIYIIKDLWLKTFPDSLTQFGRVLIKDGSEFRIGDCDVCKYKKAN
jgi:hypothetical protein